MGKIISISNQKGGVGKTTTTVNVGKELARRGKKVLIIDGDPQANLTMAIFGDSVPDDIVGNGAAGRSIPGKSNSFVLFNEEGELTPEVYVFEPNLHILGASKHLSEVSNRNFDTIYDFKENVDNIASEYDYVLIDCLPSFGLLQTAAHLISDYVVVPTYLDSFSLSGISDLINSVKNTKKKLNNKLSLLGIFVNAASNRKINVESHFFDELKEQYGDFVFSTVITKSVKVPESNALTKAVFEYDKSCDQARQFELLVSEIMDKIEGRK